MKKILVTGHSGFIGSNLTRILKNYEIIGISNNILPDMPFLQIKKDVRKININEIPKKIDCIIHLAAITDVEYCNNNPVECFDVNFNGTQQMLEVARQTDSKFIFLSTSHVYGRPKRLPIKENFRRNVTSIYSGSKIAGEILCESYAKSYGLDISIIRLFSVYGPRSPGHLVTSKIISQLLTQKTILVGNFKSKRDFVYIDDVIDGIELVLRKAHGFNFYNIGSGKSYSILDLCNILKKIAGKNNIVKSVKSQSRKHDVKNIISNCSQLKKLGWKSHTKIETGLKLTLDWFAQKHGIQY